MNLTIPAFGETLFTSHQTNLSCHTYRFYQAESDAFFSYQALLEQNGYEKLEARSDSLHRYAAFFREGEGVFLNYFSAVGELYLTVEENCRYFEFSDRSGKTVCQPQITQVYLHDYGLSYAIRLSDGRFIVIDGGEEHQGDADRLWECLSENTSAPVIAAWIFTHPHSDHYRCFLPFFDTYQGKFTVEAFLYYFPDKDDTLHYPKLYKEGSATCETLKLPELYRRIEAMGTPVYTPHTGQEYRIGDATIRFLACMDDTIHRSANINMTSLFFRMELAGQVILWTADGAFSDSLLAEKYQDGLRADILQVPHHGFRCGTSEAEMRAYSLIRPKVCLIPSEDNLVFSLLGAFREGTVFLIRDLEVEEILTGGKRHTLTLPYTPTTHTKEETRRQLRRGREESGAYTWIFTGLNTSCEEDFEFTVMNLIKIKATVSVDLIFDHDIRKISGIRLEAKKESFHRFRLNHAEDLVDVAAREIPQGEGFAAVFKSDYPVVVTHDKHRPVYHSATNE